jgi:phosphatidylglycerophosphate synthase
VGSRIPAYCNDRIEQDHLSDRILGSERIHSQETPTSPAPWPSGIGDCYSAGERAGMVWTQRIRERLLQRLLKWLCAAGITPDQVTLLALIAGLAFCPLYFWWQPLSLAGLALHVALDGLDGPLARYQRVASPRGSFTDTVSDQIVVVASTITLMFADTLSAPAGGSYIFLYTVVVTFAMVRNALCVPYSWLFRTRFLVYAWLLIEPAWPGSLEYLIWGCNLLLAGKMISGCVRIRGRL